MVDAKLFVGNAVDYFPHLGQLASQFGSSHADGFGFRITRDGTLGKADFYVKSLLADDIVCFGHGSHTS